MIRWGEDVFDQGNAESNQFSGDDEWLREAWAELFESVKDAVLE